MEKRSAGRSSKPTGRAFWAADRALARRSRSWTPAADQFGRRAVLIRSSRCAGVFASRLGRQFASPSGPWRQGHAQRCWIASTNIETQRHMSAQQRWRGPRRRCNSIISGSTRRSRTFSTPRKPRHLRWPRIAPLVGCHSARLRSAIRSVVSAYLRRSADRAVANRRDRNSRCRPPGPASSRILADEATRRRPGHSERAQILVCAGPSSGDRDAGARQSIAARSRDRSPSLGRVFVLRADLIAARRRVRLLVCAARIVLAAQQWKPRRINSIASRDTNAPIATAQRSPCGSSWSDSAGAAYARARILQRAGRICGAEARSM